MISKREILNVMQGKLESLNVFQSVRQPENTASELNLLELLPDLTVFPAAVLLVRQSCRQDNHLGSMRLDLVVIGQYFGQDSERAACESPQETVEEAFRRTGSIEFANRGQALVLLDDIVPLQLGAEYLAWNFSFEVKILNY